MMGVIPLLTGYAILGTCLFWNISEFSSFSSSLITLFAILNGDSILDIFTNTSDYSPIYSQIFLYSFIILFMYVVANSFIAIIEDTFATEKHKAYTLSRRAQTNQYNISDTISEFGELPLRRRFRSSLHDNGGSSLHDPNGGGSFDIDNTRKYKRGIFPTCSISSSVHETPSHAKIRYSPKIHAIIHQHERVKQTKLCYTTLLGRMK
eukprot:GHVL01009270.1.p2 GENE.GHVL01009270.1~~GHVL01009270.1.p2  ORF type:complete len:207 (+),score=30.51 GHVL01009270.1:1010-1630(+)